MMSKVKNFQISPIRKIRENLEDLQVKLSISFSKVAEPLFAKFRKNAIEYLHQGVLY